VKETRGFCALALVLFATACSHGQAGSKPRIAGQAGNAPTNGGASAGGGAGVASGAANGGGTARSGGAGSDSGGNGGAPSTSGGAGAGAVSGMGAMSAAAGATSGGAGGFAGGAAGGGSGGMSSGGVGGSGVLAGPDLTHSFSNGRRGENFGSGWKFNRGDVTGAEASTFDDSAWRALDVPHDWSIELSFNSSSPAGSGGGFLDGGIGWYRKTFTLSAADADRRILVDFDGVYMNSEVWINGTSLGTRPYGYSSFEYDLTSKLKFDGTSNVIAVKVNNNQPNSRWYSGSGIYRNVWLLKLDPVHVANGGVFVSTPAISAASATVALATDVENQGAAAAEASVTATVLDANGSVVTTLDSASTSVAAGATLNVAQTLTLASPMLWSVDAPYLYRLEVALKVAGATVDTYVTSLGLRTPKFDGASGFSLNGTNLKLRGVDMHHDLGALGAAVNYRAIERQLQILKGMGVNAIRTSHNPPAPELLDIADRLGVMIMEEAFDTWTQAKTTNDYALYFNDWAERDIQDMVRRDRNHPSIVLWSIGNEINGATTAIAQNLKGWILDLDQTRPVTWASNKMSGPHYTSVDHDIAALLDAVGYNYAPYAGDYDADHSAHPSWPLFGSEVSAAVRSRGIYHTPASTITKATSQSSADRQCSSYDNEAAGFGATAEDAYSYDNDRSFVAGEFIWSGFDYIGEPTPYSSWPSKSSYFGAIDTAGFPKDIYYFYKSRWTAAPMVHLLPHWNWTAGTNVTVYAYNNCDSVELFLNDTSQGKQAAASGKLHAEWDVPWAAGTLRADCTKGGAVVASDSVQTAGAAAKVVLSADRSALRADGADLAFVTVDIRDASDVLVPTADNSVAFAVSGPGQIVGVDNGNPIDTASYKGTTRKAFSGKALVIVRSTTTAGSITLTATSTGLTAAPISIETQTTP
jgi:beta-galactosidase